MHQLFLRLRGLAIASVVLALSAGAALAGGGPPAAADLGLERAIEASGHEVPVRAGWDDEVAEEEPLPEEEALDEEEPLAEEEPTEDPEGGDAPDNHGALVSEAAQMETPEGFDNHGAFVSCVARMNRGHLDAEELEALAELDLAALTVEECDGDATDEEEAAELEAAESVETTADRPGKSDKAKSRSGKGKGHLR